MVNTCIEILKLELNFPSEKLNGFPRSSVFNKKFRCNFFYINLFHIKNPSLKIFVNI